MVARDLAVQITGHDLLKARGFKLVPVDAPDHFTDETPTAVMVRQILGAVAKFETAGRFGVASWQNRDNRPSYEEGSA